MFSCVVEVLSSVCLRNKNKNKNNKLKTYVACGNKIEFLFKKLSTYFQLHNTTTHEDGTTIHYSCVKFSSLIWGNVVIHEHVEITLYT